MSKDTKIRRRAIQKKVVSVPIKDVDGLRFKGNPMSAPPSDSWSWRKYGQKPIKGSPYPRGYYRCSSSKGCPARKQVERSKEDPDMLLVTYSSEHNHPSPASKNTRHSHHVATTTATFSMSEEETFEDHELEEEEEEEERKPLITSPIPIQSDDHNELINYSQGNFVNNICHGPMINASEFGWFTDFEYYSSSCTLMLESIVLDEDHKVCTDTSFNIREDDEPFFADLGELPECAAVFRRGVAQREAEEVAV